MRMFTALMTALLAISAHAEGFRITGGSTSFNTLENGEQELAFRVLNIEHKHCRFEQYETYVRDEQMWVVEFAEASFQAHTVEVTPDDNGSCAIELTLYPSKQTFNFLPMPE